MARYKVRIAEQKMAWLSTVQVALAVDAQEKRVESFKGVTHAD